MIYDLDFRNLGPHAHFKRVLLSGVNLFLGPNGCGKSNIVYGIGWVILGVRALPPAYSQKDLIKDGTSEVFGSTTLDFIGRRLTFSRSYNGKSTKARVVDADTGEVLADNATGVAAFLASHGFDWDAASVPFCRQRDLDAFVHESPANRKKIIESLLQLEDLVKALKWLRAKKKDLPPFQDEPDTQVLNLRVKQTQDDEASAVAGLDQAKIAALVAEQELSQATLALPTDEYAVDRGQTQQTISAFAAEVELTKRRIALLPPPETELVDCTTQLTELASLLAGQQTLYDQWHADEVKLSAALQFANGQVQAKHTLLGQLDDGCPICLTALSGTEVAKILARELGDGGCPPLVEAVELEIASGQTISCLATIQATKAAQTEARRAQDAYIMQEEKKAERVALTSTLNDLTVRLATAQEAFNAIPNPPDKAAFENVRSLSSTHQAAQMKVLEWEREVAKCEQLDDTAFNELIAAHALIATQSTNRKTMETVKQTEAAFKTFRDQLLRGALTWVSGRATQVLQASGDMSVAPAGSRLELDDKLVYSVVLPDGTSQPVYRVSGGQAAVFSTCLRIALSEYLAGRMGMNGLLLLDAIFEPMNEENRAIAAHAITAYGPPQTLIFSYFDVPELGANIIPVP
jgi:hypothetical protein